MIRIRDRIDWEQIRSSIHYRKDRLSSYDVNSMRRLDSIIKIINLKVDELAELEVDMFYGRSRKFFDTIELINRRADEAEQLLTFLVLADG